MSCKKKDVGRNTGGFPDGKPPVFHTFVAVSTANGLPRQADSNWTAGWPVTRTWSPSLRSLATAPSSVQMTLLLVTRSIQPGEMRTVPLVTIGLKLSLGRFGGPVGSIVGRSVLLSGGAVAVGGPAGAGEVAGPAPPVGRPALVAGLGTVAERRTDLDVVDEQAEATGVQVGRVAEAQLDRLSRVRGKIERRRDCLS